ncbi:MAG TPA: hypothetical protein VLH08_18070 [Acidobacteriota bacterium]|nr:hypothetical protein [Acidobacteriota bacterium]
MNTTMRFVLHELELEVHDAAYLVEVGPQNGNSDALKDLSRLPSWVFHSKHLVDS